MKHEAIIDFAIELYSFYNFYVESDGFFQIRASMQADSKYYSQVYLGIPDATFVSKSFYVSQTCETIQTTINETVRFEVHAFLKDDIRSNLQNADFDLRVELCTPKKTEGAAPDPLDVFVPVALRVLTLSFDPALGLHHFLPLVFDVSHLGVLTLAVHASLVTICVPDGRYRVTTVAEAARLSKTTVSRLIGQFCLCENQSTCCYSGSADRSTQAEVNAFLAVTSNHLRKKLEDYSNPSHMAKKRESKPENFNFTTARARVSRYTTFDKDGAVRFNDEETCKMSVILVVLWEQLLDAILGKDALACILYEPLHRTRVMRMCEAHIVVRKEPSTAYYDPALGEEAFSKISKQIRKFQYLKRLPSLEVHSLELDGDATNMPIIFEERYGRDDSPLNHRGSRSPSPTGESVPERTSRSLYSATASISSGSMELLALPSHQECEFCNCRRQFRVVDFFQLSASQIALSPGLMNLYKTYCYGPVEFPEHEKFSRLRRELFHAIKLPVTWHTPDTIELQSINFPKPSRTSASNSLHLIVMVNGLYGCSTDLRLFRAFLELAQPCSNLRFLMSRVNERDETFNDFDTLGVRLASEVAEHVKKHSRKPSRISFIGFSMGNIIIRAALTKTELQHLHRHLYTFLSLSGPHMGTIYNTSMLINFGMWYLQRYENTDSIKQMALKDNDNIRNTYLYRLSLDKGLTKFKNVLFFGSAEDYIVPLHSAHVKLTKAIVKDTTPMGAAYREMSRNILKPLLEKPGVRVIRYLVHLPYRSSILSSNIHTAPLENEILVQKLVFIACAKHLI
ncbi:unnamed protein product [Ixodes hexagonus]